jgi:glycosyltransferase involved in cell wall biosynthesis
MPLVSVIIPTYKHRDYVLHTLDSVFAQTFTDYEVIVVNDGSPDDTADVLRPLVEAGRIHYIEQANAGQAAARNRGIAEAQGKYIALLDDDDLWPKDKLQNQCQLLENNPQAVMIYGYTRVFSAESEYVYPDTTPPTGQALQAFLVRNWIGSPGQTLIRADALKSINGFDPQIWGCDDWELYIRLAQNGLILFDENIALHYRLHVNNASRNVWKMYINACKVSRKHFGLIEKPNTEVHWLLGTRFTRGHFYRQANDVIEGDIQSGRWLKACSTLLVSIVIQPGSILKRRVLKTMIICFGKGMISVVRR